MNNSDDSDDDYDEFVDDFELDEDEPEEITAD